MIKHLPKYFSSRGILLYILLFIFCFVVFNSHPFPMLWFFLGLIEVVVFFYYTNLLSVTWSQIAAKSFKHKLIFYAFVIRVIWVVFSYFFYNYMTGQPFEFGAVDSLNYHSYAVSINEKGFTYISELDPSDSGYTIYLSLIYNLFGSSILLTRIVKAVISSYTCFLIYRLATRNFGEEAGRISGIIAMLLPNLIYYCGLHLKETEMVFLTVAFVERTDYLLRSVKYKIKDIFVPVVLAFSLFFFRTVLGVAAIFSMLFAVMFSAKHLLSWSKRLVVIFVVVFCISFLLGDRIVIEVEKYWTEGVSNQDRSLEYSSVREVGRNNLAKYGSFFIFIPVIIPAPFPTLVNIEGHENQMLLNGGYYVRNIYSFFVILALILLIKRKTLKSHALVLSFSAGYLLIISFSGFVLSERFHLPAVPFLVIFAGYGITQLNRFHYKYFHVYLFLVSFIIIGWNWFMLAGRGLI